MGKRDALLYAALAVAAWALPVAVWQRWPPLEPLDEVDAAYPAPEPAPAEPPDFQQPEPPDDTEPEPMRPEPVQPPALSHRVIIVESVAIQQNVDGSTTCFGLGLTWPARDDGRCYADDAHTFRPTCVGPARDGGLCSAPLVPATRGDE